MNSPIETDLQRRLASVEPPSERHAPDHFDLGRPEQREALLRLLSEAPLSLRKNDCMVQQVRELLEVRSPSRVVGADEVQAYITQHGGDTFGIWVHYPWLELIVRTLPEAEFHELRTSRNRYKITSDEQAKLRRARVGIVGLSAGYSIALSMALEGVGGSFRLADFDTMDLSNTNRVACGIPGLGTNKAVLAARKLYEIDPYLEVTVFREGVTEQSIEAFLTDGGRVDLLVEECDDLSMKVRLREQARRFRVPVIMETNDRGLIDVERFDREPDRPILHGLVGDTTPRELQGLDAKGKVQFIRRILGGSPSPRLADSFEDIGNSLRGLPQLASSAALGSALVTHAARRILLGHLSQSNRAYVDLEAIIRDAPDAAQAVATSAAPPSVSGPSAGEPSTEEIRRLVQRATTAPSGGNMQPWRFGWNGARLDCCLDRSRSGTFLDFESAASYLALGSAAETLWHAAADAGRDAGITPFPDGHDSEVVCRVEFARRSFSMKPTALSPWLESRCTNRRLGLRRPVGPEHLRALQEAAHTCSADLQFVTDPDGLEEAGRVLGGIDRIRFLSELLRAEAMSEMRWNEREVRGMRDGIDIATLEMDVVSRAALRLLRNPKRSTLLLKLGNGAGLDTLAKRSVASASAVGLLTVPGVDPLAYFEGGRAVQRVWLTATSLGIAVHPMAVAPYLFARLERGAGQGLTVAETGVLGQLRKRFNAIFHTDPARAEVFLFRIAYSEPPQVRSLRRSVDDVFLQE